MNNQKKRKIAKQILALAKELMAEKTGPSNQFYTKNDVESLQGVSMDALFKEILDFISKVMPSEIPKYLDDYRQLALGLSEEAKAWTDAGNKLNQWPKVKALGEAQALMEEWNLAAEETNRGTYTRTKKYYAIDGHATYDKSTGLWIASTDSAIEHTCVWRDYITKFMKRTCCDKIAAKLAVFASRITRDLSAENLEKMQEYYIEYGEGTPLYDELGAKIRFILSMQHTDKNAAKANLQLEKAQKILSLRTAIKETGEERTTTRSILVDVTDARGNIIAYTTLASPYIAKLEEAGNNADDLVGVLNEGIKRMREQNPKSKKNPITPFVDVDKRKNTVNDYGEWDTDIQASEDNARVAKHINASALDKLKSVYNACKDFYNNTKKAFGDCLSKIRDFLGHKFDDDMNKCEKEQKEQLNLFMEADIAIKDFIKYINETANELGYKSAEN